VSKDTDAGLVSACRSGDRKAFAALLGRYEKPVYNAAYRILSDRDDASDVTQTVFVKVMENLGGYRPEFKFYSWIYRIAVNESLNLLHGRQRYSSLDERETSADPSPEQICGNEQLSHGIQEALMTLTPDYRTVIVLKHFLDCSYRDISVILDVPEKTVKSRLFTARQRLKDQLCQKGMISA
jgi:RNA polymerase sigma-70 factor (ECF subfamily)